MGISQTIIEWAICMQYNLEPFMRIQFMHRDSSPLEYLLRYQSFSNSQRQKIFTHSQIKQVVERGVGREYVEQGTKKRYGGSTLAESKEQVFSRNTKRGPQQIMTPTLPYMMPKCYIFGSPEEQELHLNPIKKKELHLNLIRRQITAISSYLSLRYLLH